MRPVGESAYWILPAASSVNVTGEPDSLEKVRLSAASYEQENEWFRIPQAIAYIVAAMGSVAMSSSVSHFDQGE